MKPDKLKRFKGWFFVKKSLLCELFRPHNRVILIVSDNRVILIVSDNRVILIVSDNRATVGIAYPRLYESLAFINGYKKADEAIEQLKSDIRKQLNLPDDAEDFDIKFEETPKK